MRRNEACLQGVSDAGFAWDSSAVKVWDVLDKNQFQLRRWNDFQAILNTYSAQPADRGLPYFNGDMVEIPPHVGIVQELGLRMTRLRNYLGQKVVIPNRNIATVGNYTKGAQHVNIDVATASREAAEQIKPHLLQIVEEIGSQFEEVIISTQKTVQIISLSTNEYFARVSLAIWPQQQWVIEQETVPRIRLVLKNKGFEIPNDRVVVFYHPRELLPVEHRNRNKRRSSKTRSNEQK